LRDRPLRVSWVVSLSLGGALGCTRGNDRPTVTPVSDPNVTISNPPTPQPCPPTAPLSGSPCSRTEQRCTYESCGISDGATAVCTATQGWQVERVTCNPPPPPG
jgi:hypothetical protein